MERNSFQKGLGQVQVKDLAEVKAKLMQALGIRTPQGLGYRIRGVYSLKVREKELIESVFAEYGIKDIWGS
ncbi:hypothetical protein [Proteiniphilum sp. X52]|uniref:hypothetical protein n=1 Tax=Proteiniphilum sp. X52 TaxID=2382159 RepID=UPI000F0A2956|nr:hypothetical protein [Proteiniphilum sp. X52]RNC66166.1 hypothetical protein D7D25_04360 [Proteiniphilum sp. X52]